MNNNGSPNKEVNSFNNDFNIEEYTNSYFNNYQKKDTLSDKSLYEDNVCSVSYITFNFTDSESLKYEIKSIISACPIIQTNLKFMDATNNTNVFLILL